MSGVPIVAVQRQEDNTLRFVFPCPWCHKNHTHGAGGDPPGTLNYGHRVAHCGSYDFRHAQRHVPPDAQLTRRDLAGYILVDPRAAKMSEEEMQNLFDALDEIANNYRRLGPPEDAAVLRVDFKMLLKRFGLELTAEQQEELFAVYLDHHHGGRDARQAALPERMNGLCEQARDLSLSCKYLPKRQRAKAEALLAAIQNEIAALVAPPQYTGPLGTWGDAA